MQVGKGMWECTKGQHDMSAEELGGLRGREDLRKQLPTFPAGFSML